jgi:ribonuclease Z
MAIINEDVWPLPSVTEKLPADPSQRIGFTQFLIDGREVFTDVVQAIYDETNEQFGTDVEAPN